MVKKTDGNRVRNNQSRNSKETKARILEAAREAFATLGYERATVRTIAQMANIHPSMVMRYYKIKKACLPPPLRLIFTCRISREQTEEALASGSFGLSLIVGRISAGQVIFRPYCGFL